MSPALPNPTLLLCFLLSEDYVYTQSVLSYKATQRRGQISVRGEKGGGKAVFLELPEGCVRGSRVCEVREDA
jgi:hypothetical protein